MKQAVVLALAASLAVVCAEPQRRDAVQRRALLRRALIERGGLFSGGDSTTNVKGGQAGLGGKSKGGKGAKGGTATGPKTGKQKNTGANAGKFDQVHTHMQGAQTGMIAGNSGQNSVSGTVTNNGGGALQFFGGMFDSIPSGTTINSNSGMGGVANGGQSGVDGTNNNRNGGFGDGNGNGGRQGGRSKATGNVAANGGNGGGSRGGGGGSADVGGGNTSRGGDNSNSLSLSVPMIPRQVLERRALQLEEEYSWILQQKRDLDTQELISRFAAPEVEEDEKYLDVRSDDPELDLFFARDAEFDDDADGLFEGLVARDVLDSYF